MTQTQAKEKLEKFSKDATDLTRSNIEALVKSSTIMTKGLEDILRLTTELTQSAAEKQSQFIKAAMSTKTIQDWAELSTKSAQSSYDDLVKNATKITDLSTRLLTDASKPINDQLNVNVKKAQESLAA